MLRKTVSLVLCAVMLLSVAALSISCGNTAQTDVTQPNSTLADPNQTEASASTTVPERLYADLPEGLDFGGHTFTFLSHFSTDKEWVHWNTRDLYAEKETGEPMNDAVFRRNSAIEEKYNVKIREFQDSSFDGTFKKTVKAGDDIYDAVVFRVNMLTNYSTSGNLLDMSMLPYINFNQPWWDKNSVDTLSVSHKIFAANSDITVLDNDGAAALVFSKNLVRDLNLESPYQLVTSGKWTLEALGKLVKGVGLDVDGDTTMTEADRFGLLFQRDTVSAMFNGCGGFIAQKDENDLPKLTFDGARNYDVFTKMFEILYDHSCALNVHKQYEGKAGDGWNIIMNRIFHADRALFMWIRMRDVENLRSMETDFGIVPMPKFDDSQTEYYTTINPYTAALMGVPVTCSNYERTSVILEALACESKYTLTPAYYEINLQGKIARDTDSQAMLDLIFKNPVYDIGDIYKFGGLDQYIYETMTEKNQMPTFFEKRMVKAQKDIDKVIEKYNALA